MFIRYGRMSSHHERMRFIVLSSHGTEAVCPVTIASIVSVP